jgi:hypothetical protein
MSHLKSICRNAAILGALSLVLSSARAGDSSAPQTAFLPRMFEAAIRNGEIVGREGQTRRVFVTRGTNEFYFVVPQGMRVEVNPDMVAVVSADSTYFLTLRILSTATANPDSGNLDFYREMVSTRFPGVKVMEEYPQAAAGRNGLAFELRVKIVGGVERAVCVALIPSAAGVLEFTLNTDTAKLTDARNAFNTVQRTFRSNENGKLEIIPRAPDQS